MSQTPSLEEVIDAAVDERLDHVHTSMPGRVLAYNAQYQSVDVQPDVRHFYTNEVGDEVAVKLPVIKNVPLVWPGAGTWRLTFPIEAFHTVLLVFASCELNEWKTTRRARGELGGSDCTPHSDRRFKLSDAVAIPGLIQFENIGVSGAATATNRIQLGNLAGPKIEVTNGQILLGGSMSLLDPVADESAVLGDQFSSDFDTLLDAFNTYFAAIKAVADPSNAATPAVLTAMTTFKNTWNVRLSNIVKVK